MDLPKSLPITIERDDYRRLARRLRCLEYRQNGNGWYRPLGEEDYPRAHLSVDGRYRNRAGFNLHVDIASHRTSDQHHDFIQSEYVLITGPLGDRNRPVKHGDKKVPKSQRKLRPCREQDIELFAEHYEALVTKVI